MHTLPLPHCAAVVRLHISSRRPICIRTSPSLLLARRLLPIEHGSTFVRSTILALFSLVECVQDCVYSRVNSGYTAREKRERRGGFRWKRVFENQHRSLPKLS